MKNINLGCAWVKCSQNTGKTYLSIQIDEFIKKMYPQLDNFNFAAFEVKEKKSEKAPDYEIVMSIKEEKVDY